MRQAKRQRQRDQRKKIRLSEAKENGEPEKTEKKDKVGAV